MATSIFKWTAFGIISVALCGWLVHLALLHVALTQELTVATKLREAQLHTISTWRELDHTVHTARGHVYGKGVIAAHALKFSLKNGLSTDLPESFDMPDNYSLLISNDLGSGFFLQTDEESKVIAYLCTLTLEEADDTVSRRLHMKQTLESPDRRITLPVKTNYFTEYQLGIYGNPAELKFGCQLTDRDESRFVPFCDVTSNDADNTRQASSGPYDYGFLKNREYRVKYGWPFLSELGFVKSLQVRGIWHIISSEFFWLDQSKVLHVVLVFASEREWRLHPDYLYGRTLDSGLDLEWDPHQENYLIVPKPSKKVGR